MTDEQKQQAGLAIAKQHLDAARDALELLEQVIDARLLVATYIARAGSMMATMRAYKATDEAEIRALAELFVDAALDDKNQGDKVLDGAGNMLRPPGAKLH